MQIEKARSLWQRSLPGEESPTQSYLRNKRQYNDHIPQTIRYLPPLNHKQHPAMIAAIGTAEEAEPGTYAIQKDAICAVHLTLLRPDGCDKAGTDRDKLMVGSVSGNPICLAPPNDLLGLAITEGIEDALTIREATGLGVWAAGSAQHMRKLGPAVPWWTDCVMILADDDEIGQTAAAALADDLLARGLTTIITDLQGASDD
jgi:hypothetical protein